MFKGLDTLGSSPQFSDMDLGVSSFRRNCYVSALLHTPTCPPTHSLAHTNTVSAALPWDIIKVCFRSRWRGSVMRARLTCFKHMHSASRLKQEYFHKCQRYIKMNWNTHFDLVLSEIHPAVDLLLIWTQYEWRSLLHQQWVNGCSCTVQRAWNQSLSFLTGTHALMKWVPILST